VRERRYLVTVAVEHAAETVAQQLAKALVAVEPARQGGIGLLAGVATRAPLRSMRCAPMSSRTPTSAPSQPNAASRASAGGTRDARRALARERVGLARERHHRLGGRHAPRSWMMPRTWRRLSPRKATR